MIDWEFSIGDLVHDLARRQNGTVTIRKYQEDSESRTIYYNVCYCEEGKVEYEWGTAFWLRAGKMDFID